MNQSEMLHHGHNNQEGAVTISQQKIGADLVRLMKDQKFDI